MADKETFPAVIYMLDATDKGHNLGARFKLEQFDCGEYYFTTRKGLNLFCAEQGFSIVLEEEMLKLRRESSESKS